MMKKTPPSLDRQMFSELGDKNKIWSNNTQMNKNDDLEANCSIYSIRRFVHTGNPKDKSFSIGQEVLLT